jgi:hypothetical protein
LVINLLLNIFMKNQKKLTRDEMKKITGGSGSVVCAPTLCSGAGSCGTDGCGFYAKIDFPEGSEWFCES